MKPCIAQGTVERIYTVEMVKEALPHRHCDEQSEEAICAFRFASCFREIRIIKKCQI